jgi:hypothetical protein
MVQQEKRGASMSNGWLDILAGAAEGGLQGYQSERERFRAQKRAEIQEQKALMAKRQLEAEARQRNVEKNKTVLQMLGEGIPENLRGLEDLETGDLRLIASDKKDRKKAETRAAASDSLYGLLGEEDKAGLSREGLANLDPSIVSALIQGGRNRAARGELQEDRQAYGKEMLSERLANQKELKSIGYSNSASLKRLGASLRPAKGGGRSGGKSKSSSAPAPSFNFNIQAQR